MAVPRGFEPLISALTTRRLRPLTDGTVCTYQEKTWCRRAESNRRHEDFQSSALPTELPRHISLAGSDISAILNGGRNRVRTCDPLLVRQVLYR